ncbi:MAG: DUF2993 domain-containing protein [Pseudanabaenaceae cyanobacterium]|jgi:hypothetical protein
MSVLSATLIPIVKLWLRSQVEAIATLEITVAGKSRQILSGDIPEATVSGTGIVYQNLHITSIDLRAAAIHLNVGQMLKGEALKLLDPIQVMMDATLSPLDLQQCLQSPILLDAIKLSEPPTVKTDGEIRQLLETLLAKLGEEFILEELTIADGGCRCRGAFQIAAT